MKKMWIVAAIACAALMVSCGGEKKKSAESVEDKAKALYEAVLNANNEADGEVACEKWNAYLQTLEGEDLKKACDVADSLDKAKLEAQIETVAKALFEANQTGNFERFREYEVFYNYLSPEDQEKFHAIYDSLESKYAEPANANEVSACPIEAKAQEYVTKLYTAEQEGDMALMRRIDEDYRIIYYGSLSDEEKAIYDAAVERSENAMQGNDNTSVQTPVVEAKAEEVEAVGGATSTVAKTTTNDDVVVKAEEYVGEIEAAYNADNYEEAQKINAEAEAWLNGLF
jgi:hypothetical protein